MCHFKNQNHLGPTVDQYFPVVLLINKVVLNFQSVDEILNYGHTIGGYVETYTAPLSGVVYHYTAQAGSDYSICG